jgi:hypothetical protein
MSLHTLVSVIGAAAALVAAVCWLYSALIEVPNNIDTIVQELQRISYWNGWAAAASCVAAFFGFLSFGLSALQ